MPLAKEIAHQEGRRLPPWIDQDDIESAALYGLIQAALRFRPEMSVPFSAFCRQRIRGEVRELDRRKNFRPTYQSGPIEDAGELVEHRADPLQRASAKERHEIAWDLVAELPIRLQMLCRLYHGGGLTLRVAGRMLKPPVNESRACALHNEAMERLKELARRRGIK